METRHTPGPWLTDDIVAAARDTCLDLGSEWTTVCSLSPDDGEVDGIVAYVHRDNAPLVTAAPDLLAALKGLVAWDDANATLDPGDDVPCAELADLLNAARAAIAEAEGR